MLQIKEEGRQFQSGGARRREDHVFGFEPFVQHLLSALGEWTVRGRVAVLNGLTHILQLVALDRGLIEPDSRRCHRRPISIASCGHLKKSSDGWWLANVTVAVSNPFAVSNP